MSLEQKIMAEMKTAMLNKDEASLRGIRAIKAAIIVAKTEKGAPAEMTEDIEIKILQKLAKQRKDSIEIFEKEKRDDLAKKEKEELSIIERFLPAQMSADELRAALKEIITQVGATSAADMGKVMGAATKSLGSKTDGKSISTAVKELLG